MSETHGRSKRLRGRELGLPLPGTPGPLNAITDVPGVAVGYTTLIKDSADGKTIRTGVTTILPRKRANLLNPVWAGTFSLNGNGELTGCHWINEAGCFTGPIAITNTFSLGIVHHAIARWLTREFPGKMGETGWPLPVVGETYDGWLNDIAGFHITEEHVFAAIESATTGCVAEGNVGGGTGMVAYEFKGGTGTSSRRFSSQLGEHIVGAVVQANHGVRPWLRVCGVAVGELMPEDRIRETECGSIIVVVATDAPLLPTQLARVARRVALGVGRAGTPSGNNSGDIFLAFSTANDQQSHSRPERLQMEALSNDDLDTLFLAVVESVEEAIINAMLGAETMQGKHGHLVHAINPERLRTVVLSRDSKPGR